MILPLMLSIVLFFIYLLGIGYSLTRNVKTFTFEYFILCLGVGLAAIPIIGTVLNLLHIPIDWRIFLCISIALPIFDWIQNRTKIPDLKSRIKISPGLICLIIIFIASALLYCGGPFTYKWLEDDDPWQHAASTKYIALEKNLNAEKGDFQYLNPYPPGYNIVLAIVHQTNPSIYITLKFFNGLILALGILLFYIFAKELSGSKTKGVWATFFLACLPCYLSHFIWAHSMVIGLLFPTLYCLLKSAKDKKFVVIGGICFAGCLLTQPTQPIKFVILFFLICIAQALNNRTNLKNSLAILLLGTLLSMAWWFPIGQQFMQGKFSVTFRRSVINYGEPEKASAKLLKQLTKPSGGTATRIYTLEDFVFTKQSNKINNPVGLGIFATVLICIGFFIVLIKYLIPRTEPEEKIYILVVLFWSLFTFFGINTKTFNLPVGLFAFRFWMLFAISSAFLAAETSFLSTFWLKNKYLKLLTIACIVGATLMTSANNKVYVNTRKWSPGVSWASIPEVFGHTFLRDNLKPDTKVFSYNENYLLIGFDMLADFWTEKYKKSFHNAFELSPQELYKRLKENKYQYITVSHKDVLEYGTAEVNGKLNELVQSKLFIPIAKTDHFILLKVL